MLSAKVRGFTAHSVRVNIQPVPKIQLHKFTLFSSAAISGMWVYHEGSPPIMEILTY